MDDRLLERYIENRVTENERIAVIQWLEQDTEHLDRFARIKAASVFAALPCSEKSVVEPAIRRSLLRHRIERWAFRVAAVLFLPLAMFSIWLLNERNQSQYLDVPACEVAAQQTPYIEYRVYPGVKGVVVLPDSSVVRLNSDSRLRCPREFSGKIREVELVGEAYFEVHTDREHPMYIRTPKGITAVVTGTEFNISAYENDANFRLTLINGKVSLHNEQTQHVIEVEPNKEVVLSDLPTATPETHLAKIDYDTAWIRGLLVFEDSPMDDVIRRLERWYGVHIEIQNQHILDYHLTASFDSESIAQVMELLRLSVGIRSEMKNNNISLFL